MKTNCNVFSISGLYDFALSGGAIGVIDMTQYLPKFAYVVDFAANATLALTTGGAATIAYGIRPIDNAGAATQLQALLVATPFGAFNNLDANGNLNPPVSGTVTWGAQLKTWNTYTIVMSIAGAALTAGKLQFTCVYIQNEF